MDYDVIIIGAGPGGIFAAYELTKEKSDLRIAVLEGGPAFGKEKSPIDGDKINSVLIARAVRL